MQDINNKLAALLETLTDFFQNFVDGFLPEFR